MDIRRTVLLMIFSFSLLMLWNNWQIHQGNAPLFGAPPVAIKPAASGDTPALVNGVANVPASVPANSAGSVSTVPGTVTTPATQAQTVNVQTDVLKLAFDLQGAQLVRAELLAFPETEDQNLPVTLLERSAGRIHIVQSGLTGAPAGQLYPTHLSPFTLISDAIIQPLYLALMVYTGLHKYLLF